MAQFTNTGIQSLGWGGDYRNGYYIEVNGIRVLSITDLKVCDNCGKVSVSRDDVFQRLEVCGGYSNDVSVFLLCSDCMEKLKRCELKIIFENGDHGLIVKIDYKDL